MDILQNIDVGLVVLDRDYQVCLWNQFMQNHSGSAPEHVLGRSLFEIFPSLPREWFCRKAEPAFVLQSATFTTWEQRPYLFHFPHYRPITGVAEFMYQNSTIIPLLDTHAEVSHICLILYDVTDSAISKIAQTETNHHLQGLSRIDHLTQLYNRGHWEHCLDQEFKRFDRYQIPCTLIMFDIDHFKKVNDTYGHSTGDEVIRMISQCLRDEMRETDIAGRYGGEEFCTVLTATDASGGLEFAERLRNRVVSQRLNLEEDIHVTISLGICELTTEIKDTNEWIERADQALYQSKEKGRNQSSLAGYQERT
ncbi:sensor domain-containing diguanylate cyclase [Gilvimarinus sp. DA14]|uniref:GGDEF domain-containing protein n=1 Tax=Gilvimarinus sp. DA14 TaxID=2956798 RepID=UPI0020B7A6BA|nr:sensor domain-containing diguanylate cyclase [Gilvimarinus sp. DA14]UTF60574.1 GGDEF domain-containing protein [Gilvimarinus sp. DA14]